MTPFSGTARDAFLDRIRDLKDEDLMDAITGEVRETDGAWVTRKTFPFSQITLHGIEAGGGDDLDAALSWTYLAELERKDVEDLEDDGFVTAYPDVGGTL